jgi:hypothetical protein
VLHPLDAHCEPLLTDFRTRPGAVRLVMLVSPTCPPCVDGAFRAGGGLLSRIENPEFRCYFVWLPVLPADSEPAAVYNEAALKARRGRHYWDSEKRFSERIAAAMDVPLAWDMYLLYPRGDVTIDQPTFWMHQIDTDKAPRLDVDVLAERALGLLGAT